MSNASPIVCIRIPPLLLAGFDECIKRENEAGAKPAYTRSSFLLLAASVLVDKLDGEYSVKTEVGNPRPLVKAMKKRAKAKRKNNTAIKASK